MYRFFFVFLCLLFVAANMHADVSGSIRGYVRDSSGAVISGAHVSATELSTNLQRSTTTDAQGSYSFLALPPGRYRVVADMTGFREASLNDVDLKVNDELRYDLTLTVGATQDTVSVDASAVQVQTASTALGTTIESPQILAMPLNGRSYLDLLALQPGVAPANTNGNYNDRSPSSGLYASSGNVSTDGQPEYANAFLVNGAEVNETKNMGAGLIPNADSIAEFRLLTNSFSAEYGKFSGSIMNTVTKSGTNRFHGTLFEFYRNQGMDATTYFDLTKPELKQHQFGGVLGGPIWKDKIFFFTDLQQTRQVAGASTGVVQLMTADERNGIFPDSVLNTYVQGDAWAATLMARGGGTIVGQGASCPGPPVCTPTMYSQLGTPVTTGGVPGHDLSAYEDPVTKATIQFIPLSNLPGGEYSDSSHKGSIVDSNMSQRIDFINHSTGDWSFYYH